MRVPIGNTGDSGSEESEQDEEIAEVPPLASADDATSSPALCTRGDNNLEPVSYNNLPEAFFENLHQSFAIKDIVDFTPGDGCCAMAFLRAKKAMWEFASMTSTPSSCGTD